MNDQNLDNLAQVPLSLEYGGVGDYRVFPITWTTEKKTGESRSVSVRIRFGISAQWDPDVHAWTEFPPGYYIDSWIFIVGRDGKSQNEIGIGQLRDSGLWEPGDFDALLGAPPSIFCLLRAKLDSWQGKQSIKADWVSPDAEKPPMRGSFEPVDPSVLQDLKARFGPSMKAMRGGPPKSAPAVAPPVAPAHTPMPASVPPTAQPPTARPPTAQPPTARPPTAQPPTADPPPVVPPPASGAPDDPVEDEPTPF
jgi:hypothetical protein